MALKKISFKTTSFHQGRRLDHVLAECLPGLLHKPISKAKVRKLIVAGAVYLNGRRVRIASKELFEGLKVEAQVDLEKLSSEFEKSRPLSTMSAAHILFEDGDIIVVNKPAGLPTQPTLDDSRDNLFLLVKKFLAQRAGLPLEKTYLGLHHRLDRDTSGVILLTKSQRANPGIADIFSKHTAQKIYQALTVRSLNCPPTWTIKNYLGKSSAQRSGSAAAKKNHFGAVHSGGDFAHTEFTLLEQFRQTLWVEAKPITGRTHQIRVHLAEGGLPILGDPFYGGPISIGEHKISRVMLHAVSLTFPHPMTGSVMTVRSPLPNDFSALISLLKK